MTDPMILIVAKVGEEVVVENVILRKKEKLRVSYYFERKRHK